MKNIAEAKAAAEAAKKVAEEAKKAAEEAQKAYNEAAQNAQKQTTITTAKAKYTVKVGKKVSIRAKATNKNGSKITYRSGNKKIATVSSKGVIRGRKKGSTKITIKCNGVKKTVRVKVK